ncbi:MTH1187 family thiamine-binding protein [Desulfocurvus sp. DL9XJH121]
MSVIVELAMFPMDKGESVSPYVAGVLLAIRDSGLPYDLNPMGTCIEGEWDEVMDLVGRCFKDLQSKSDRVYMTMKVDWRKGRSGGLSSKTASVRAKMD